MTSRLLILLFLVALLLPFMALAQQPSPPQEAPKCDVNNPGEGLCNPFGSTNTLLKFVRNLIGAISGLVGILAILMVTYSGAQMIISQGDPDGIKKAKASLQYSILGFVIAIMAYVIVAAIENFIGLRTNEFNFTTLTNPLRDNSFMSFVTSALSGFFGFLGILAVLLIIISGFRYVTSAGNEDQAKKAKTGITWAIVGLVTILFGYVIIQAVENFFRGRA